MTGFELKRLGQIMEPEPGNPLEVEGVLNPAAVRGPDGELYLFPRLVARDNYSRIGIARVKFDEAGDPCGVERLGIALEPEADYELWPDGRGGCEDPRITFVERLQRYVMTYTGHSSTGPRIALAVSEDLLHWKRLGLATFEAYHGIDFVHVDNKDASFFPVAIPNHCGKMQMAILHRPLFPGTRPEETACQCPPRVVDLDHESIWISYCPMALDGLERCCPRCVVAWLRQAQRIPSPTGPLEGPKPGPTLALLSPLATAPVDVMRNRIAVNYHKSSVDNSYETYKSCSRPITTNMAFLSHPGEGLLVQSPQLLGSKPTLRWF